MDFIPTLGLEKASLLMQDTLKQTPMEIWVVHSV